MQRRIRPLEEIAKGLSLSLQSLRRVFISILSGTYLVILKHQPVYICMELILFKYVFLSDLGTGKIFKVLSVK